MSLAILSASIYKSWRMSAANKRAVSRMTGIDPKSLELQLGGKATQPHELSVTK
jgi:hypothetical protein